MEGMQFVGLDGPNADVICIGEHKRRTNSVVVVGTIMMANRDCEIKLVLFLIDDSSLCRKENKQIYIWMINDNTANIFNWG